MKNTMHFVATLLLLGACSDSKTEETAARAAPASDEGKALTKAERASKVVVPKPAVETGPTYSDELADKLIAEVAACESALFRCDAADTLSAFGKKATARLVAKLTEPDVSIEVVINLSFI
ncbi:MAG: hypothetical protein JKY56_24725, partial [Kofleriaceae bacterium]|nr:hypothetical protein [Kofleriaceae bacterium]